MPANGQQSWTSFRDKPRELRSVSRWEATALKYGIRNSRREGVRMRPRDLLHSIIGSGQDSRQDGNVLPSGVPSRSRFVSP